MEEEKKMYRKVLVLMLMVFFMAGSLAFAAAAKEETRGAAPAVGPIKPVDSIKLFRGKKFDAHYRAPNESRIETILDEEGIPLTGGLSGENRIGAFKKEWMKRNPHHGQPREAPQTPRAGAYEVHPPGQSQGSAHGI